MDPLWTGVEGNADARPPSRQEVGALSRDKVAEAIAELPVRVYWRRCGTAGARPGMVVEWNVAVLARTLAYDATFTVDPASRV